MSQAQQVQPQVVVTEEIVGGSSSSAATGFVNPFEAYHRVLDTFANILRKRIEELFGVDLALDLDTEGRCRKWICPDVAGKRVLVSPAYLAIYGALLAAAEGAALPSERKRLIDRLLRAVAEFACYTAAAVVRKLGRAPMDWRNAARVLMEELNDRLGEIESAIKGTPTYHAAQELVNVVRELVKRGAIPRLSEFKPIRVVHTGKGPVVVVDIPLATAYAAAPIGELVKLGTKTVRVAASRGFLGRSRLVLEADIPIIAS